MVNPVMRVPLFYCAFAFGIFTMSAALFQTFYVSPACNWPARNALFRRGVFCRWCRGHQTDYCRNARGEAVANASVARRWKETAMNPKPHPDPPAPERMSKGKLWEYHLQSGTTGLFSEVYPENRPACLGERGCPCPNCCKIRGRELERGGR